jgi:copper(I)-binding protein
MEAWHPGGNMRALVLVLAIGLASPAFAHEGLEHDGCDPMATFAVGDLTISGGFSRAMLPNAPTAGGYMIITNAGTPPDTLLSAKSEAAKSVQLHSMTIEGDIMTMGDVADGIEIPAGGTVTLEPNGLHMMFMGIGTPFKEGECVEVTLTFAHAGNVPVVLAIGGAAANAPPMQSMKGM